MKTASPRDPASDKSSVETENIGSARFSRQSVALAALWLGFVVYGFIAAPPSSPDTLDTIRQLSTGQWADLNSWVVALFNCMGLWPLIYAAFALADGHRQPVPAWPFVAGSFALGAFALMPYLALRRPSSVPAETAPGGLVRWLNRSWLGWGIAIAALALFSYPFLQPGGIDSAGAAWQDFCLQWQQSRFIHIMTLDFCMLTLLTPTLLWEDMAQRGLGRRWRAFSLVPLLGAAMYLALRPQTRTPQTYG